MSDYYAAGSYTVSVKEYEGFQWDQVHSMALMLFPHDIPLVQVKMHLLTNATNIRIKSNFFHDLSYHHI